MTLRLSGMAQASLAPSQKEDPDEEGIMTVNVVVRAALRVKESERRP